MTTDNRPLLALFLLSLIWGYSWVILKIALGYADPFTFSALRVGFGAFCLFAMLAMMGRPLRPTRIPEMFALGAVQTAGYVGLSMWATAEGAPGRTAVLVFTMPFWTILLASITLRERIRRYQWITGLIAGAGLALILQPWVSTGHTRSKIIAVLAGLVWAASAVMVKRMQVRAPMDPLSMTAWQMLFGTIPLIVIALSQAQPQLQWTPTFTLALAFNAAVTTAAGWWLWVYVLKLLPTGVASMSMFAIPVIAMLSSWLQLGERPNTIELTGMVLLAAALLMLSLVAVRQHREITAIGQE